MSGESNVARLTIDGKQVEVERGSSILQAATKLGIKIPTLCYHKALPAYGACRLCLVEVSQGGGPAALHASCTYPAQDGLVVKTDTERVKKTRKVMVELMLARCPEAEEVRRLAREMGVEGTRLEPKNEDCLLCGLCVRMCRDRMGKGAIGFAGRGDRRVVQPAFDVQSDVCQTCGACFSICPTKCIEFKEITRNKPVPILSEFDEGLRARSAIYISYPQAVPNYATIDAEHCVHLQTGECQVCKEFCEADAIDFNQKEQSVSFDVGAVIVADGADKFDPSLKYEFGYGKFRNVVTSVEFERILAASGPFAGHVQRPHDGKVPRRIAWIQCVGSRDEREDRAYCSSVCCMYAIKEATIAKEHVKEIEPTIFYMDIRAHGKDFDAFFNRARDQHGVRFVRSRVGKVLEIPESGNLLVYYTTEDNPRQLSEEFDMVVLSVGLEPRRANAVLADKLDVKLNKHRFLKTSSFAPVATSRPGIFVCGPACGPKDIPETVMEASGAASAAEGVVAEARGTAIVPKTYPPERDVRGEPPRIGVFVCHCGINIGSVVDVPGVVEFARGLPGVVYAEDNLFTCSQDTQQRISRVIGEQRLNRVVVASCSPRTHEPLFQETLREAGLNPCLFEMANIRDQCSW
ncbi:(2Fe-2S)-binding protein, partial [candidate division WOR-3 bacterium]|nr:(2Fe-2S)-binding protein [candidate division WOR-3 bacterium]